MNKLLCMVLVAFVVYLVFIKDSSCPMFKEKREGISVFSGRQQMEAQRLREYIMMFTPKLRPNHLYVYFNTGDSMPRRFNMLYNEYNDMKNYIRTKRPVFADYIFDKLDNEQKLRAGEYFNFISQYNINDYLNLFNKHPNGSSF